MRFPQFIAVMWLALCAFTPAHAEKRVALVVGNERYANLSANEQLQKAVNDARAVGGALKQIGFEVISGENLARQALLARLDETAQRLSSGDTVFFFFAGHGVTIDGLNYVLPTDVPVVGSGQVTSLTGAAVKEEDISAALMRTGARVVVVVLDACRNNPFASSETRGVGGERGLAPHEPPSGVFTLYSAGRSEAALDRLYDGDSNPNSVFTRVLVPALMRPGLDLPAIAVGVREEVARIAQSVGHRQRPAYYDETIGGQVYLNGAPSPGVVDAARVWEAIKNTTNLAVLDQFIRQFGNVPIYGALARARREELAKGQLKEPAKPAEGPQTAAVAPPVTPAVPASDPCSGPVTVSFASTCAAPLTAAQERGLKPKDSFRECENCPEMVVVPAGSFTMGSLESDKDRSTNEGPEHTVTIGRAFGVGKFHVTRDQFAAFVSETAYAAKNRCYKYGGFGQDGSWRDPGFAQEGSHPVVCVSWDDAKAYVAWMAKKTGKPYRLLSEAEFEYAANGRTSTGTYARFWFGDNERDLCRYGNFGDQKAGVKDAPCDDEYGRTAPAGHYAPNTFGLYDMAGNAWQWTEDCWHISYNTAPADGSAWTTACEGRHVVRGGSWYNAPAILRTTQRSRYTSEDYLVGFRVARTLAP